MENKEPYVTAGWRYTYWCAHCSGLCKPCCAALQQLLVLHNGCFFMSFSYIPFGTLFHYTSSQGINIVSHTTQWASLVAQSVKNLPAMQETWVGFLGWEDSLEKEIATHFGILAWRIPWNEEPGRLQSMGSQESDTTSRLNCHHHTKRWVLVVSFTWSSVYLLRIPNS